MYGFSCVHIDLMILSVKSVFRRRYERSENRLPGIAPKSGGGFWGELCENQKIAWGVIYLCSSIYEYKVSMYFKGKLYGIYRTIYKFPLNIRNTTTHNVERNLSCYFLNNFSSVCMMGCIDRSEATSSQS